MMTMMIKATKTPISRTEPLNIIRDTAFCRLLFSFPIVFSSHCVI